MFGEVLTELEERGVSLHLSGVKGPVRDVLHRSGIWDRLETRIHASTYEAIRAITTRSAAPANQVAAGIDERHPEPV
jgi:hypothetical protein